MPSYRDILIYVKIIFYYDNVDLDIDVLKKPKYKDITNFSVILKRHFSGDFIKYYLEKKKCFINNTYIFCLFDHNDDKEILIIFKNNTLYLYYIYTDYSINNKYKELYIDKSYLFRIKKINLFNILYVRFITRDNYDFHYYQDDLKYTIRRVENIIPTDEFLCYTKYKIPIKYEYNYNEGNNTYIQKYGGNQLIIPCYNFKLFILFNFGHGAFYFIYNKVKRSIIDYYNNKSYNKHQQ